MGWPAGWVSEPARTQTKEKKGTIPSAGERTPSFQPVARRCSRSPVSNFRQQPTSFERFKGWTTNVSLLNNAASICFVSRDESARVASNSCLFPTSVKQRYVYLSYSFFLFSFIHSSPSLLCPVLSPLVRPLVIPVPFCSFALFLSRLYLLFPFFIIFKAVIKRV